MTQHALQREEVRPLNPWLTLINPVAGSLGTL
jgi:hypothetical protein